MYHFCLKPQKPPFQDTLLLEQIFYIFPVDSVMTDCGFIIESDLKYLKVDLNITSFLGGRAQLTVAEVSKSQTIASMKIHVEHAIQRVKELKVIRNEMPLTLHGSANHLKTVYGVLCNFLPPLI